MKKILLFIGFVAVMIPNLVNAKETINKIIVKNIEAPLGGETAQTNAYIDTPGLTGGVVQWQTENGSANFEVFSEGTKYGLYLDYIVDDNYEVADNVEIEANIKPVNFEAYPGWICLYYITPGEGVKRTVTFNTMGGSEIDPSIVSDGDLVLRPTEPTKEGYIFDGWYKDSSYQEEYDFYTKVEEDITLYAKWILEESIVHITSINISGVELPLGDDTPRTNAHINTDGLIQTVSQWQTVDSMVNFNKFEFGKQYVLYIGFNLADGYDLSNLISVKANETPDQAVVLGEGVLLYYTVKKNMDIPINLDILKIGTKNIKLGWNKIIGAKGYIVYTSTNGKKWKKLTTTKKNTILFYNNTKLKPGTTHYYKVVAYKTVKKKNVTILTSKIVKVQTVPSTPKLKIKGSTFDSIRLNISKISGAKTYVLERSTDNKNYQIVATLSKYGNYTDKDLIVGTKYYYRVTACNERCGGYSKIVNKKVSLKTPSIKVKSSTKGRVKISYKNVDGSEIYEILRSTKKNGSYTLIGSENALQYIDNVSSKKTYYYKVRATRKIDEKIVYSAFSKPVKVKVK